MTLFDPAPARRSLSVRINEADGVVLRKHLVESHRNLLDAVCDGPLANGLDEIPDDVLLAVHKANHMATWSRHPIDDWLTR